MKNGFKSIFSIGLIGVLLFCLTGAAFAASANPTDVPTSHWAYKSVKLLLDKGYLQLYQDQTFQGDQPVDRYTLATVVAKILGEVASGSTGTNREDVKILRSLTNEFRDELVKVLTENSSLAKKLEDLSRQDQIIKEDLTRTKAEQIELQKEVQQMIADIVVLKKKVEQLEADVAKLKEENKRNKMLAFIAIILGAAGAAR